MDKLEKFILEHRNDFDDEIPRLHVWAGIERKLNSGQRFRLRWIQRLSIAASVVVLLFSGVALGTWMTDAKNNTASLATVSPEYAEMQRYFEDEINSKLTRLANYDQNSSVFQDIHDLDAMFRDLQRELQLTPPGNRGQVVQAMISNYKARIEILEQVLQKLQMLQPESINNQSNEVSI